MRRITVRESTNMKGEAHNCFFNVPYEDMEVWVAMALVHMDMPVFVGLDVGKRLYTENAMAKDCMDLPIVSSMPKRQAMLNHLIKPNHAMVITGVRLDEGQSVQAFRVRNSWGTKDQNYSMTSSYFKHNVFFCSGAKNSHTTRQTDRNEPIGACIHKPAWDVLGQLADNSEMVD